MISSVRLFIQINKIQEKANYIMNSSVQENAFARLGLGEEILSSLKKADFITPSPIQQEVIPHILMGRDVIGHAQTGTGKTAAFALPALQLLQQTGSVEVLVITPTRELASQVSEEMKRLGSTLQVKVATIYGGKSFQTQISAIQKGAQIVVATPGRLLDLLQGGKISPFSPSLVIIDEADEMLDMGFLEDLQEIFTFLPETRQTLMFSATMPSAIQTLAKKILKDPLVIKAAQRQTTNEDITQRYCLLRDEERDEAIVRLFAAEEVEKAIVFCRTKKEVDRLHQMLSERGNSVKALHGDMEQPQREAVIAAFRNNRCKVLIATDVAARGLNILDVTHVINYHIPFDAENYVHRIGRTGRAGRKGISITFVTPKELSKLWRFQKVIGNKVDQYLLPSKKEIRSLQVQKALSQLSEVDPAEDLLSTIKSLSKHTDPLLLSARLLQKVLLQDVIQGPEMIGILDKVDPSAFSQSSRKDSWRSEERRGRDSRRPPIHRGRSPRMEPDTKGCYPKKKFVHAAKKPKRKFS